MALKIQVSETKIILQNLLMCTVVFYTVYYLCQVVCFIALRLENFDEFGPFDFKTIPSWTDTNYLVMMEFPQTTHWWISLGTGLTAMISEGQILAYLLFRDNFIYPDLENF
ncbi:putative transmembrane protein 244 [Discoglossus pictus]